MRQVLKGGLLGAAPGVLLIGVVVILHALDVITSDESQIGFVGIPLLFFGLLIGLFAGAAAAHNTPAVAPWMGIGLAVGLGLSIAMSQIVVGGWLILVPLGMLGGAVFGAWRHESRHPPRSAIPH